MVGRQGANEPVHHTKPIPSRLGTISQLSHHAANASVDKLFVVVLLLLLHGYRSGHLAALQRGSADSERVKERSKRETTFASSSRPPASVMHVGKVIRM